jgi:hypothetical protein
MSDATYNLNGSFKPTLKRFADLDGPDFFPTPRWATLALIENEKFNGGIRECACGIEVRGGDEGFDGRRIHVPLFAEARSIASNSVSLKRQPSASRLVLA